MNVVVLQGLLASPLVARDLPAGGVAVSFDVSTRTADGVVSVPASWIAPSTILPVRWIDAVSHRSARV
jgi:hypothetical protein